MGPFRGPQLGHVLETYPPWLVLMRRRQKAGPGAQEPREWFSFLRTFEASVSQELLSCIVPSWKDRCFKTVLDSGGVETPSTGSADTLRWVFAECRCSKVHPSELWGPGLQTP